MEEWKQIQDYESYEVSSFGNIRHNSLLLKKQIDTNKYESVMLCKQGKPKRFRVHSLVAQAFLQQKEGCVIDHIDTNRQNNCISNLHYITQSQNLLRIENTNPNRNIRKRGKRFQVRIGRTNYQSFSTFEEAIHYRDQTLNQLLSLEEE